MNNMPPFSGLGGSLDETARRISQIIDLDKASADDIRRWTLVGIVDLHSRIAKLEEMAKRTEQMHQQNQRLILGIGALAWIALVVATAALARMI